MSSKILKEALIQQKEIQEEADAQNPSTTNFVFPKEKSGQIQLDDEEDIDDFNGFAETQSQFGGYEVNYQDFSIICPFGLYIFFPPIVGPFVCRETLFN